MNIALNDNLNGFDRHPLHEQGTTIEFNDDEQAEPSEVMKLLREAAILESIAKRLFAGEIIDWDNEQ